MSTNGEDRSWPFLTTRSSPDCWATKIRPSGATAIAVGSSTSSVTSDSANPDGSVVSRRRPSSGSIFTIPHLPWSIPQRPEVTRMYRRAAADRDKKTRPNGPRRSSLTTGRQKPDRVLVFPLPQGETERGTGRPCLSGERRGARRGVVRLVRFGERRGGVHRRGHVIGAGTQPGRQEPQPDQLSLPRPHPHAPGDAQQRRVGVVRRGVGRRPQLDAERPARRHVPVVPQQQRR